MRKVRNKMYNEFIVQNRAKFGVYLETFFMDFVQSRPEDCHYIHSNIQSAYRLRDMLGSGIIVPLIYVDIRN